MKSGAGGDVDQGEKQRTGKAAQPNAVRVTTPYMTKYERARVLGTRALQIRFVHPISASWHRYVAAQSLIPMG